MVAYKYWKLDWLWTCNGALPNLTVDDMSHYCPTRFQPLDLNLKKIPLTWTKKISWNTTTFCKRMTRVIMKKKKDWESSNVLRYRTYALFGLCLPEVKQKVMGLAQLKKRKMFMLYSPFVVWTEERDWGGRGYLTQFRPLLQTLICSKFPFLRVIWGHLKKLKPFYLLVLPNFWNLVFLWVRRIM